MLKIAFDIGGVLSKHRVLRDMFEALQYSYCDSEVYIITDMHDKERVIKTLKDNLNFEIHPNNIYCADYAKYGEACKQILCDELGIDILIDDFIGYVANGNYVRLLVMPDVEKPYWSDDWKVENEAEFGRRCYKRPPGI